jgi:hypothetical protein
MSDTIKKRIDIEVTATDHAGGVLARSAENVAKVRSAGGLAWRKAAA